MKSLIVISHLRWDFVWQRPQHLLSRLAKHYKVLFAEEPITRVSTEAPSLDVHHERDVTVVKFVQPVATPNLERGIGHGDPVTEAAYGTLLREYCEANGFLTDETVLWLYTPMGSAFIEAIPHNLLVFDVMDQLSAFKGAPRELQTREAEVLRRADIVFTGGASLYRDKLPHNANTHLFPSGVEIPHFAQAARRDAFPVPPELADLPRPILGYYGVIDERMDMALLAEVAAQHPEWTIVLIGPIAKIDKSSLPEAANIVHVGMKTYEQLPAYLAHFDVALVPFAMNEATRYLSPTKTLEYMAANKPIVSTPIHDVIELYGSVVRIAGDARQFAAHILSALSEAPGERRALEEQLLAEHTWDSIAERMHQVIESRRAALAAADMTEVAGDR